MADENNEPSMDPFNNDNDENYNNDNNYDDDNFTASSTGEPGEPIINSMTARDLENDLNEFSLKNDSHLNLIYRRMLAGQCFRLPSSPTCPDDIFESWFNSFLTDITNDEDGKSRSFRFTWTQNRPKNIDALVPIFHVAKDIQGLISIVEKHRLVSRTQVKLDNGAEPTVTNWKETLKLQIFSPVKIDKNAAAGIEADIPATEPKYLAITDGIVNFLTGDFYKQKFAGMPGFVTQKYFSEYDENLALMKSIYKDGGNAITLDLLDSFKAGTWPNYTATVAAVKRRYKRSYTQETMMDYFRKIDEVLSVNNPTEFKMQHLRTLISTKFLSETDNWPAFSDFEGDSHKQKYPEEHNAIIATLLQYIMISHEVDRSNWDKIQRAYHQEIKGKVDYLAWHENRSELYRVIDDFKNENSQHINVMARYNSKPANRQQSRPSRGRSNNLQQRQNRPQPPRQQNARQTGFRPNITQNMQNRTKQNTQARLKRMLCMHCSRWAGANRYHNGPWGGGPNSKCPYDKQGNFRPGFNFVNRVDNMDVNTLDIPHYQDIESEGLEYVDPWSLNTLDEQQNSLVARAMGDN